MVNSIYLGKLIYKLLSEDTELSEMVGNNIFPLIADHNTNFPFITFYRDNIISNSCKDGYYEDSITFTVTAVADNYIGSLDIANRLRHIIEKRKLEIEDLTLHNVILSGVDESYEDNAYIQRLSFVCTAH